MAGLFLSGAAALTAGVLKWGSRKAELEAYSLAASDYARQAAFTAAAQQRQAEYLFKTAAERTRDLYETYAQTAGSQKVASAAAGADASSGTVQQLLKSSRLNALLDQRRVQSSLDDSLYENSLAAAEKIYALNESAAEQRKAAKRRGSWWNVGRDIFSLLS